MNTEHSHVRQILLPVLAALIWGTAFVAQSIAADYVEPFTFNTFRSIIASLFLGMVLLVISAVKKVRQGAIRPPESKKHPRRIGKLMVGGFLCGTVLTTASYFQQLGIETTSVGKAGFITALYIVIVPVAGLFFRKKLPLTVGLSVLLAAAGLYFLCIDESFNIAPGDVYVIICAFCFSAQILLIDHYAAHVDGIALAFIQLLTVSLESGIFMLIFENPSTEAISDCIIPLLYVGVFSSGVAYTLQILAQKDSNPTVVSLLLSLEAVFSTIAGALILHETLLGREYAGCAMMLAAVILSQLPRDIFRLKKRLPPKSDTSASPPA